MVDYVKKEISLAVMLLAVCAAFIALPGSSVFAEESYPFTLAWGSLGSGDGQFNSPEGIDN